MRTHSKVQVWIHTPHHVLLLKLVPDRGSDWQPVTGGVDPGEALPHAAWREAQEETGLPFQWEAHPSFLQDLGLQHEFQSRWGNPACDHAFAISLKEPFEVQTDPTEHVDHQWIAWAKAESLLKWPFQKQVLQHLMKLRGIVGFWAAIGIALIHSVPVAHAGRSAIVTENETPVYQSPKLESATLDRLSQDSTVEISNKTRRSVSAGTWRKVRLSNGTQGYVQDKALRVLSRDEELRAAGIQSQEQLAIESEEHGKWSFQTRIAGAFGYLQNPEALLFGGEVEFNSILFANRKGHERRAWGLGVFGSAIGYLRTLGASVIYRPFTHSRWESELRLRAGYDLHFSGLLTGLGYAMSYPFSTVQRAHWSAILEGQLYVLNGNSAESRGGGTHVIAGIGYHF